MIRLMICVAAMLMATTTAANAQTTQPTTAPAENVYVVDFTKTMGKYELQRAEGQLVAGEGLKLTNLNSTGGPMLEEEVADISATPVAVIEVENLGQAAVSLFFKVKAMEKAYTKDRIKAVPGKSTLKIDLSKAGLDLKELDYVKLFGNGPVNLVVKSISFEKAE